MTKKKWYQVSKYLSLRSLYTVFPQIIARGYFLIFRTKRGRLFQGGDYFIYYSLEVVP